MSEDNKSLSDDLDDMIGDVKEGAKRAADKAEEFAGDAKEKATEFAGEAKEKFTEFAGDAKDVLSDGKNVAIIAHIHLIGWIIALVMNNNEKKSEFASFYIRQMLGLVLASFIWIIPLVGWILGLVVLVFWIMSLISAIGGKKTLTPIIGEKFQEWFKSL
jgi:uncharacterized membrane protein